MCPLSAPQGPISFEPREKTAPSPTAPLPRPVPLQYPQQIQRLESLDFPLARLHAHGPGHRRMHEDPVLPALPVEAKASLLEQRAEVVEGDLANPSRLQALDKLLIPHRLVLLDRGRTESRALVWRKSLPGEVSAEFLRTLGDILRASGCRAFATTTQPAICPLAAPPRALPGQAPRESRPVSNCARIRIAGHCRNQFGALGASPRTELPVRFR